MSGAARALGAAFVLAPALATAGPNAGGALVLHVNESIVYSDGVDYCGQSGLNTCQEARVTMPVDSESAVVCFVVGAFASGSSPRVKAVAFGIDYDVNRLALTDQGPCGGFELPTADWPRPGEGTALVLDSASEAPLVEVYWFAAYVSDAGEPTSLEVVPHPIQGGQFADDSVPAVIDPIEDYGRLGFGEDGYLPCPGSGAPDGPDGPSGPDGPEGPDEPGSSGLDPWEFNPCNESVLVAASWGSGWADFAPPTHWGEAPEWGPGPFAVDESGRIFIMDSRKGDLKVYAQDGSWDTTIQLPERSAVVPLDLAVLFDIAVWREGQTWIRMMDLNDSSSIVSSRTPSYEGPGTHLPGTLRGLLITTPTGIVFHDQTTCSTTSLTTSDQMLPDDPRPESPGLELSSGIRICRVNASVPFGRDRQVVGPIVAGDGSRALGGDIVSLSPDGSVSDIFVKSAGGPIGINSSGEFLAYKTEQVGSDPYANYVDIYSNDGSLVSRTRQRHRAFVGMIDLRQQFCMGDNGFYEIWISHDGVYVSQWSK